MSDLHELLHRAAGDGPAPFDATDIGRRVRRRERRHRLVAAAIILVFVASTAVVYASARTGDDQDLAVSGSSDPGIEELTADRWVANAVSTVSTFENGAWIELDADGIMRGHDGCSRFDARWAMEGARLLVDEVERLSEECDGGISSPPVDFLTEGAIVGRSRHFESDGLELRLPADAEGEGEGERQWIHFRRFDRIGAIPSGDALAGSWTVGDFEIEFDTDGTLAFTANGCASRYTWQLRSDVLRIESSDVGASGCLQFLAGTDDGATARVRLERDRLWVASTDGTIALTRVTR